MPPLLKLFRPYSWIKNLFIFVPLFFARDFFIYSKLTAVVVSFIVFCIAASSVYILNDIFDKEQDGKHSAKKNRPIASGAVLIKTAATTLILLIAVDAFLIYFFVLQIAWLIGLYFILNILYSAYLKHVPVIDIVLVSSFYFIRVIVGGIAAHVPVSNWLLLSVVFISLFLIVAKRLAEFSQDEKRAVLSSYTPDFLNAMLVISAALIMISYSLYSILSFNSYLAIISILFVLFCIIRYLFLVFTTHRAEYPERLIVSDKAMLASGLLWICTMYLMIYLHV